MDAELNRLAELFKPVVDAIEAMPETTKGHYGDYMAAIDKIAAKQPNAPRTIYIAIGVALQRAGANKFGVQSALRAMGHL